MSYCLIAFFSHSLYCTIVNCHVSRPCRYSAYLMNNVNFYSKPTNQSYIPNCNLIVLACNTKYINRSPQSMSISSYIRTFLDTIPDRMCYKRRRAREICATINRHETLPPRISSATLRRGTTPAPFVTTNMPLLLTHNVFLRIFLFITSLCLAWDNGS